jgi:predicted ATPase
MALFDLQSPHYRPFDVSDSRLACWAYAAFALWELGYPDQALRRSHEMLQLAQQQSHPFNLAQALYHVAVLHAMRCEVGLTRALLERQVQLATEHAFMLQAARGTILLGWALAMQGMMQQGIEQMQQGLAALQAAGDEVERPFFLACLADVYRRSGQISAALEVLADGRQVAQAMGRQLIIGRLYRLTGECLLAQTGTEPEAKDARLVDAEACFRQALALARRLQAKSLELQTAMSLSRLWQQQGQREAAWQLLADVYGWFTEGCDTVDLQEARQLLVQLA